MSLDNAETGPKQHPQFERVNRLFRNLSWALRDGSILEDVTAHGEKPTETDVAEFQKILSSLRSELKRLDPTKTLPDNWRDAGMSSVEESELPVFYQNEDDSWAFFKGKFESPRQYVKILVDETEEEEMGGEISEFRQWLKAQDAEAQRRYQEKHGNNTTRTDQTGNTERPRVWRRGE